MCASWTEKNKYTTATTSAAEGKYLRSQRDYRAAVTKRSDLHTCKGSRSAAVGGSQGNMLCTTTTMRGNFSCCQGWENVTLFNYRTEMCCGGIATFVEDTAFGQCCGDVGFDRRTQSCPHGQD